MKADIRVDERLVASLWERQAFDPAILERLGISVVFRGVPSDAGGPDYQDAILSWSNRELVRGDVEFHVRSSDWKRHGHHADPRYNQVVLHIVWSDDGTPAIRADGRTVPTLEVGFDVTDESAPTLDSNPASLLPHPCVSSFAALSSDMLMSRVRRAGLLRFEERRDRFAAELGLVDPDKILYAALFESLGYASNAETFRRLADLVPYAWLRSIPECEWTPTLLDAARLGPPAHVPPPARLPSHSWRLARIRPGNHPAARLAGIAQLLPTLGTHPAERLTGEVLKAERPSVLTRLLTVAADADSGIGAGRATEIAVSVVLPFVAAVVPGDEAPARLYGHYPSPPSNRWTRLMQNLLRQAGHRVQVRSAPEHQGLHHLYHRFCRLERFTHCPVCSLPDNEHV